MYKRLVGVAALLSLTLVTLGMSYPQENEIQINNAIVEETAVATLELVDNINTSVAMVENVQEQGAESVRNIADAEAIIHDSDIPLIASVVEATKRKTTLSDEERMLMYRVVSAESRGESFEAQYSVACVVLNRMESPLFPDTASGVILQKGQFSCVPNGAIYRCPITESVMNAVDMALDNNTVDPNVLWFRSDYYHSFFKPSFKFGRMYFSSL